MLVMEQIEALAEEVQSLLSEVRDSWRMWRLAKGLVDASGDVPSKSIACNKYPHKFEIK